MKTYIFIHGGESFGSHEEYKKWITSTLVEWNKEPYNIREEKKKWKTQLANKLLEKGNVVYFPSFPNPQNAKYEEWKVFFESWIKNISIQGDVVMIGSSLGGCFLLKYFSDMSLCYSEVRGICLGEGTENEQMPPIVSMAGKSFRLNQIHLLATCISVGDFTAPANYEYLQQLGNRVHIWHAEDDIIVPFSVGQELSRNLPGAETHFFSREKGYRHFHGIERIMELEEVILVK